MTNERNNTTREDQKADFKDKGTSIVVAGVKTAMMAAGMVAGGPLAALGAGLAAELVSIVVPHYKQVRYDQWVNDIEDRFDALKGAEQERAQQRVFSPEFADLFEDATRQAVRAISDERRQLLANLLMNSLTDEQMDHAWHKRLLDILDQLNDAEILLMHGSIREDAEQFFAERPELFSEVPEFGCPEKDENTQIILDSYNEHLVSLNLFKYTYEGRSGKKIKFNFETGKIKEKQIEVTGLGLLLLHEVGLGDPNSRVYSAYNDEDED